MKVPPKRKGNQVFDVFGFENNAGLNESPSEKEGKLMLSFLAFIPNLVPQ